MKFKLYVHLAKSFYQRMHAQNVITILIFVISIVTTNAAFTFYLATNNIQNKIPPTFFEYKSISIAEVRQVAANNDLITLSQYRRPKIATLHNMMERLGTFAIKPDYTAFLNYGTFSLFDVEVVLPQFVIHQKSAIGINECFYEALKEQVAVTEKNINLHFQLNYTFEHEGELLSLNLEKTFPITFIFEEINYFNIPKIFIPQNIIDTILGQYRLNNDVTVANLIYNLPDDHLLTNRQYRLHFDDEIIYKSFLHNILQFDGDVLYELKGDDFEKGELFAALFSYLRLLVIIFLCLVIAGVILITLLLTNAFIEKNKAQIALFQLFNYRSFLPYQLFISLYLFNFSLSYISKPLLILFFKSSNIVIFQVLGLKSLFTFHKHLFLLNFITVGFINMILLFIIAVIKLRKPVLTTLLAHD